MNLGDMIRQLRMQQRLSIIELAKRTHVSEAYILNIESGKITNPSFFNMLKIARELNLDVYELEDLYIDPDWISLMEEARGIGLSSIEVRQFLQAHMAELTK
ncbi:helix-turn-helix domain-containing protein [Alkalihalobacillus sp. AL-G]|uniref:helix-turn-helix domain-containing protein n=1 Tax=Alkalihalobacillus sp. AL-G TaxID=2926399 RepID=UPI00272C3280|nr:helix-turn-helix domain-containing protein [Alkalihalobacillus sp. AL-G]WLD91514.1 helix-turn-helix domain-containing protein [Alkalihalobacillus sp. AL-G]